MEKKHSLRLSFDILMVLFIPFFVVLFFEFVLRFGMGPFVEHVSFISGVFASLIAICSFVWIKKGIIFGFVPIILSSIVMMFLNQMIGVLRLRFFYFFASFLLLTFIAILTYAMSRVLRKGEGSYARTIAVFFLGLIVFMGGMVFVDTLFGLLNPDIGVLHSVILGIRSGLILGCGVSIVILLLSQRNI